MSTVLHADCVFGTMRREGWTKETPSFGAFFLPCLNLINIIFEGAIMQRYQ